MLLDALKNYCPNATPMHMPGHMRSNDYPYLNALGAHTDITEINGFDDLHNPSGILLDSMKKAASLWGSDHVRYLVNGSTCGILASVYALSMPGGRAVISRNAHKALYHALEITGIVPVFVESGFDEKMGACTDVSPKSIEKALENTPDAKFVFVTSPTYEGVISDIKKICEIAHRRNVPVIVDEAHGAHLDLTGDFSGGAVRAGADIVIQSVHKTLLSLTQTAVMHISGNLVSVNRIDHALDIFETSSPSYLLIASIDGCVEVLSEKRQEIFRRWRKSIDAFRQKASALKNISLWKSDDAYGFDESKLVLMHPHLSGVRLTEILRERFSIELEAAYPSYAIAMTGAGTKEESLEKLFYALSVLDKEEFDEKMPPAPVVPGIPETVYSVKDALTMPYALVKIEDAAGHVSAEYAWAYPPGVPVIVPGERIGEKEAALWKNYLASGVNTVTTRSRPGFLAVIRE